MPQKYFLLPFFILFFSCGQTDKTENLISSDSSKSIDSSDNSDQNLIASNNSELSTPEEIETEENADVPEDNYLPVEMNELVVSRKTEKVNADENQEEFFVPGKERKIIFKPEIKNDLKEKGIVTVLVSINADGVVVKSEVIKSQKTNTSNQLLLDKAIKYSKEYLFETLMNGPETTQQYIHINFE
ncbi:MAG: hypothetical protein IPM77_04025 [Crocinitomicaceae bacterium]|nr:hypothetical protein [Crocinitomicaceae bacterium]